MNTAPPRGPDAAQTAPPWAATMAATMDSPSPEPPLLRARERSAR